jgi:hypothetical protein
VKLNNNIQPASRLRMNGVETPFLPDPSWHEQGKIAIAVLLGALQ